MKGTKALQQADVGSVIKIADQPARLHMVWRDRKSGLKRICRPKMLIDTFSAEEKAWEILDGRATEAHELKTVAAEHGLKACRHCIRYSGL